MEGKIVTAKVLGIALLDALGIDSSMVTEMTIKCSAGEFAQLTVTRAIPDSGSGAIVDEVSKYRLVEGGATGESASPSSHARTSPVLAGSRGNLT